MRARSRTRTDDPFLTMEVLYQLSYPGGRGQITGGTADVTRVIPRAAVRCLGRACPTPAPAPFRSP